MKYIRRVLVQIFVMAAILTVMCVCVFFDEYFTISSIAESFNTESLAFTNGYEVNGDWFSSTDNDPQIGVFVPDKTINNITLEFAQPYQKTESVPVEVFYIPNGATDYVKNDVTAAVIKGKHYISIDIPDGVYRVIRIDVGQKAGIKFKLDNITINKNKYEYLTGEAILKVVLTFLMMLIISGLFQICWLNREKIKMDNGRKLADKHYQFINILKILSIFMIVLFHFRATGLVKGVFTTELFRVKVEYLNIHIATLGVSLFFLISGTTLMISNYSKFSVKAFYKRRIIRLFLPFYVTYVAYYILLKLTEPGKLIFNGIIPKYSILWTVLGMDGYLSTCGIATFHLGSIGEWFLGVIILLYIMFPFFRKMFIKNKHLTMLIMTVLYVTVVLKYHGKVVPWQSIWIKMYDFLVGMYMALNIKNLEKHRKKVMAGCIFILAIWLCSPVSIPIPLVISILIFSLAVYLLFFELEPIFILIPQKGKRLINWISSLTFEIFLAHHAIIYYIDDRIKVNSSLQIWGLIFLELIIIMLFAIILKQFIKLCYASAELIMKRLKNV